MVPDYYAILGITPSATKDDIKKAYRNLALKYHPDVSSEQGAQATFIKIHEAYSILLNEESRKLYNTEYTKHKTHEFIDIDLKDWINRAKSNANKYARMKFNEFTKEFPEVVKETSKHVETASLKTIGYTLTISGIATSLIGNLTIGIILLGIGVLIIYKNN